jgi:cold shock CspA family protein
VIGHVKFFNVDQRYGIIVPEGKSPGKRDEHVFFYENVLEDGVKDSQVNSGAEVEYELIPNIPWKRALWVRPLSRRSYAPVSELRKGAAYGSD